MPAISIIMPTYNGATFIEGAIESVLQQSYKDWELIIISDGSTDTTDSIVRSYIANHPNILFIENEQNVGIQKSLNKGLSYAKGKYIARLDDDDRWIDEHKLVLQVSYFDAHPECVLLGTDAVLIDTMGKKISRNSMPKSDTAIRKRMYSRNCFLHATVMFRRDMASAVGNYSESPDTLHVEDYDLWLRLGQKGSMANLSMVSTALTVHTESLTNKNRVIQAWRMIGRVRQYKGHYPRYRFGVVFSYLRYFGFYTISIIPIPKKVLLFIQRVYKSL